MKPSLKESSINLAIILLPVLIVWGASAWKDNKTPECTQADLYETTQWSTCTTENIQTRELIKNDEFTCKNPGKVDTPELEKNCTYIPECNEQKEPCGDKYVYLFKKGIKEHTTIIENRTYSPKNHNNLSIVPHGKFQNIKLTVITDTKPEKIPEYYYLFFGIDKYYAAPRVIGTSRIRNNQLDLKDHGVFQGSETPRTLKFNLNKLKLARPSKGYMGFDEKNYTTILNANPEKELKMTLFLADGNSMTEKNINQRIFGVVTDAWFEFECETNEECSIEKLPAIIEK